MTFSITSSNVFAAIIALDRCLAMVVPAKYRTFHYKYLMAVICPTWIYVVLDTSLVYILMSDKSRVVAVCTNVATYSPSYSSWTTWSRATWTLIAVVLCMIAIIQIMKTLNKKKIEKNCSDRAVINSIKTICIVVTVMVLTQVRL